jgi:hypothetical protein
MKLVIGLAASVALLGGCGESASVALANQGDADIAATTSSASPVPAGTAPAPTPEPAAEAEQDHTIDRTHRTGFEVLKTVFLASGEVDGAKVTGMTLPDRCRTVFVTAEGETAVDWTKVGNFAGRTQADRRSISIDDGSSAHDYSVAEASGATVESAFGVLADECQA